MDLLAHPKFPELWRDMRWVVKLTQTKSIPEGYLNGTDERMTQHLRSVLLPLAEKYQPKPEERITPNQQKPVVVAAPLH